MKKKQKLDQVKKMDGLYSALTGAGYTSIDKLTTYSVSVNRYSESELSDWLSGCGIFAKICETPVNHIVRNGFKVKTDSEDFTDKIEEYFKTKKIHQEIEKAMLYGRVFGGAGLVLITDDLASAPKNSKNELVITNKIKLKKVLSFNAFKIQSNGQIETDYNSQYFGLPKFYLINGITNVFHASRVLRCDPMNAADFVKEKFSYWSPSILAKIEDELKGYLASNHTANYLLADTGVKAIKIEGLIEMLSMNTTNDDGTVISSGDDALKLRMQAMEYVSSKIRGIILDSKDSIERMMINFAGIPEMLEKSKAALSAVVSLPRTLLFNESPSGLGSTGNTELTHWKEEIKQLQENEYRPLLEPIINLALIELTGNIQKFTIEFNPLDVPTEKEIADLQKVKADTAVALINDGVVDPMEVRNGLKKETVSKLPYEFDDGLDVLLDNHGEKNVNNNPTTQ